MPRRSKGASAERKLRLAASTLRFVEVISSGLKRGVRHQSQARRSQFTRPSFGSIEAKPYTTSFPIGASRPQLPARVATPLASNTAW
jgi:hypothetical protein